MALKFGIEIMNINFIQELILTTKAQKDYELLDSGDSEKLERYGSRIIRRPDPQTLWKKSLSEVQWKSADANFKKTEKNSGWISKFNTDEKWPITFGSLNFNIRLTTFKHTGLFPEQLSNWVWMSEKIKKAKRPISVLNLFGYTGGATLACSQAGASVCHVDGSKTAITWARENAALSRLEKNPIRWILDDAREFVKREIKRGVRYDAVIMDPPAFGHGPKKELWKIEDHFVSLFDIVQEVLNDNPLFVLINGYASGYSSIAYENNLLELQKKYKGILEKGELTIEESKTGRLLPCGIFARWAGI